MFTVSDTVVYPGQGVAQVNRAIEKTIAGHTVQFYELTFLNKDMTILIPVHSLDSTGIRRLSSLKTINGMFDMLSEPTTKDIHELTASNWNKRNKEYQCKLRTGDLEEIGRVYRDLKFISTQKELSFGEKNLLHQTEILLAQEISIVKQVDEDKAIEQLRSFFALQQGNGSMASKGMATLA